MQNLQLRLKDLSSYVKQAPLLPILLLAFLGIGMLGLRIAKLIKDDDTQGVYYGGTPEGYRKRYAQMMGGGGGGGGNGTQSSGYGKNRPSPPGANRKSAGTL